jgi:hypothetical protein
MTLFCKKDLASAYRRVRVASRDDGHVPFSQAEKTGGAALYGAVSPHRRRLGFGVHTREFAREITPSLLLVPDPASLAGSERRD